MDGRLASVTTSDRVRLDGFYVAAEPAPGSPVDAAVITHGLSGNFYTSRLLKHLACFYVSRGISPVLINTRGHDYLNLTVRSGRSVTLGAAYEQIDECPHDLNAWVDFLVDQGHQNILLTGHSLGAIKTLYAQAHDPHPQVVAACGLSATRISYDALLAASPDGKFASLMEASRQRVARGQGQELMYVDFPFPTWMSAGSYLEKYGPSDRFNWLEFVDRIQVPAWVGFGELELKENPVFVGLQDDLDRVANRLDNVSIETIQGADHFYSARYEAVESALGRWLDSCCS
ncbi:MAG: alpha/beta fold hydrolase [Mariniblastus sp.]|nr:alpha/beta fold hydrolase [Mariniblastus sp.]